MTMGAISGVESDLNTPLGKFAQKEKASENLISEAFLAFSLEEKSKPQSRIQDESGSEFLFGGFKSKVRSTALVVHQVIREVQTYFGTYQILKT